MPRGKPGAIAPSETERAKPARLSHTKLGRHLGNPA